MIKFSLSIKGATAALTGELANGGTAEEVARILEVAVAKLRDGEIAGVLRDSNGNKVGAWHLEAKSEGEGEGSGDD